MKNQKLKNQTGNSQNEELTVDNLSKLKVLKPLQPPTITLDTNPKVKKLTIKNESTENQSTTKNSNDKLQDEKLSIDPTNANNSTETPPPTKNSKPVDVPTNILSEKSQGDSKSRGDEGINPASLIKNDDNSNPAVRSGDSLVMSSISKENGFDDHDTVQDANEKKNCSRTF